MEKEIFKYIGDGHDHFSNEKKMGVWNESLKSEKRDEIF